MEVRSTIVELRLVLSRYKFTVTPKLDRVCSCQNGLAVLGFSKAPEHTTRHFFLVWCLGEPLLGDFLEK